LLGRSAGAQIALLAAYTLHDADLKGVVDFYGPADMVWGYSIPANPLIMDSRKVMENYLGGSYQKVPQNFVASSPLEFVDKTSIPTLIIHGDNDVIVSPEHSRRLNLKLQQNGIKHFLLKLPWATHGFDYNLNGPGGQLSTYTVERFLKAVCH
jgi:acetyl esterase/lipase